MLVLLMYNMVGYSITYFVERCTSAPTLYEDIIAENINSPNLIIKVPINAPDQKHWSSSGPIDSHLEGNGQFYQITAQQIVNDTLYVYCQYDQAAREHFVDLVSKIQFLAIAGANSFPDNNHSRILKHFLKDYVNINYKHIFFIFQCAIDAPGLRGMNSVFTDGLKPTVALPPPDIA